ncbi:MAG: cation:proton antiporter [Saprospiraceae bacterium]|nr:cation:proton antiporter [Saprospiraceae bacterium]
MGWLCTFFFRTELAGHCCWQACLPPIRLISYPIVNRLRISRNEAVSVAVGGTIITDILALVLLAVISGMAQGVVDGWFWLRLALSVGAFGALVFGLLPRIARWFFRRVESDITNQFVFVLTMLFVSGILAELAGIEAIIGAFLAGLVLNRLIPHSSPLMNRIEFVGNALFIPAFLFSVGMLINLHVFIENPHTITMALVLTAFALLSKWLAAFFTQKIFGYSADQGKLIFGLTSSTGRGHHCHCA